MSAASMLALGPWPQRSRWVCGLHIPATEEVPHRQLVFTEHPDVDIGV